MSHEFRLNSEFEFPAEGPNQFSYLGANNLHIKVEAASPSIAREVGQNIAAAMNEGSCPAAQVAILYYIDQANQKGLPLACTLSL